MIKKYETILLDVDGTLLDFHKTERYALEHTFQKFGVSFTEELYEKYREINHGLWNQFELGTIDKDTLLYSRFIKLFEVLGIRQDGIAFEDEYQRTLGNTYFYIDDCLECLKRLGTKYRLYIVTNGVSITQVTKLRLSGIDQLVIDIFVSEDTGFQKPMREYFDHIEKKIPDYQRETTLIVGDSLSSDMKGGINSGIDTCWFCQTEASMPEDMDITYRVTSLRELMELLEV
jgi:2-haloacid dehalogenase